MKLLIDTHIWLWGLLEPKRLSGRVARALLKPANEIWLSPISTWEVLALCRKGQLVLRPNASGWIAAAFERTPLREAPLTHDVVMAMEKVVLPHRDPADCFLAASAQVYGLTLVSADENLLAGNSYSVLANR